MPAPEGAAYVKGIPTVSGLLAAAIECTEPNETGTQQGNAGRFGHDRLSCQSEGFVEGPSSDNIGADAQPVGIEKGIASPRLQVREAHRKRRAGGNYRPCPRQPQKFTICRSNLDLGHKEVMIGWKVKRCTEIHIELNLLTRDGPVAACCLTGHWMDAAGLDRVECGKSAKVLSCEGQITRGRRGVAIVEFHIRRRIDSRGNLWCRESGRPAGPANIRVGWKYPVNFDADFADI